MKYRQVVLMVLTIFLNLLSPAYVFAEDTQTYRAEVWDGEHFRDINNSIFDVNRITSLDFTFFSRDAGDGLGAIYQDSAGIVLKVDGNLVAGDDSSLVQWTMETANYSLGRHDVNVTFLWDRWLGGTTQEDTAFTFYLVKSSAESDPNAPSARVTAPTYSTNQSPTSKFNVRWTADSADSYDVQYKIGVGGAWKSLKSGTTATSAYFTGDPGKTYYFRARAKKGGQTGAWSAKKSTVVPYNQSAMTYKGSWGSASASKMYKASSRFSARKNASATYAFKNARKLSLIITKRPRGGKADVFIDGAKIKTIDFYAAVARYRKAVAIKEFTAPTSGELKVVVNHTKNSSSAGYRIELDGVGVKR